MSCLGVWVVVVVSNMFYFHTESLVRFPSWLIIFQMGWNQPLVIFVYVEFQSMTIHAFLHGVWFARFKLHFPRSSFNGTFYRQRKNPCCASTFPQDYMSNIYTSHLADGGWKIWAIYNDLSRGHPKWWFSKVPNLTHGTQAASWLQKAIPRFCPARGNLNFILNHIPTMQDHNDISWQCGNVGHSL